LQNKCIYKITFTLYQYPLLMPKTKLFVSWHLHLIYTNLQQQSIHLLRLDTLSNFRSQCRPCAKQFPCPWFKWTDQPL